MREFTEQNPALDSGITYVAKMTNQNKEHVAVFFIVVPILMMFLGGGDFVIDMVAYLYPAYASIKAIETTNNKEDDTQWLTYWLVFSLFKFVESIAQPLISLIPLYFIGKVSFLVWCFYPGVDGAKVIYTSFISPHVVPLLGLRDEKKTN